MSRWWIHLLATAGTVLLDILFDIGVGMGRASKEDKKEDSYADRNAEDGRPNPV